MAASPGVQIHGAGLGEEAAKVDGLETVSLEGKCTAVLQPNCDSKVETGHRGGG